MPPPNTTPLVHEIAEHPSDNLAAQPDNILAGVITASRLPLSIRSPTHIDDMHERIRMSKIIQEFIPQTTALVGAGYQSRNVKQLDRNAPLAVLAAAVVGLAVLLLIEARACTVL